MKNDKTLQLIHDSISNSRIKEALQYLSHFVKGKGNDWENEAVTLQGQYTKLESDTRIGILSRSEENMMRAKIINAALSLADLASQPQTLESLSTVENPIEHLSSTNYPIKIFISYSHEDKSFCTALSKQLKPLERRGTIEVWSDGYLIPGEEWDESVKQHLNQADIVLFLVSADFVDSDYIHRVEMKSAIQRYHSGQLVIIPIVIRACDFSSLDLSRFQALPPQAKPVKSWLDQDEAWVEVVKGLKKVIAKLADSN